MSVIDLRTVERLLCEPTVVVGSLPPQGRDLDLLTRDHQAWTELRRRLLDAGWIGHGHKFARLDNGSTAVVELLTAADLGLADEQAHALFEHSAPLDGVALVRQPAPHHALLILARRVVRDGPRLSDKRRARIEAILAQDHAAFEHAEQEAARWGTVSALAALRASYERGTEIARARRVSAIVEERSARGDHPLLAVAKGWRAVLRTPRRRAFIVALSGLDGAGKSTQALALRDALDRLGYPAEVRWSSLVSYPGFLTELRKVVNWMLGALERLRPASSQSPGERADEPVTSQPISDDPLLTRSRRPPDAAKLLRVRSPLVAFLWTSMVALRNGVEHRRLTRPNLRRGGVVICDRYLLDSSVALRYTYGEEKRFGFQSALVRLVSPAADRAFLLAVSPETASRRKADYELEQNILRAKLYDEEAARLDVRRVDGERPEGEVLSEIVGEVWRSLNIRGRRGRGPAVLRWAGRKGTAAKAATPSGARGGGGRAARRPPDLAGSWATVQSGRRGR
jgi:thymidylate kinase